MTGIWIRVNRDGRWQNVEFEYLTEEEQDEYIARCCTLTEGWTWAKRLAQRIRECCPQAEEEED